MLISSLAAIVRTPAGAASRRRRATHRRPQPRCQQLYELVLVDADELDLDSVSSVKAAMISSVAVSTFRDGVASPYHDRAGVAPAPAGPAVAPAIPLVRATGRQRHQGESRSSNRVRRVQLVMPCSLVGGGLAVDRCSGPMKA